ncbi:uncharacterized protein LOC123685097 [Harmonia axyridis]|uniref:uncharacterized protein LOC123685097 n=1 Tax=Harmonia axyridis TaxID=115357 RepID=UPI001E2761E6|nr:uncharacterized protein LOC123685097 [Harmonia axyridis]
MKLSDFNVKRRDVFALYDKTESDINQDIQILREWMSQSPHLPSQLIGDDFIELCLLKNKFSLEKCKKKIEMYCTLKADPHYDYIFSRIPVPGREPSFATPLPVLTDGNKRLLIYRIYDAKSFEMAIDLNCQAIMREVQQRYDYNDGEIQIIDLRNCPISILSRFRLNVFDDGQFLILQGFSTRISAIHVVSKIGKALFSTVIPLLPKKLSSRMSFHDDIHTLKDVISPKYLPRDYGGELQTMEYYNDEWRKIFEENQTNIEMFVNTKSYEELRIGDMKDEKMKGTFKQLTID